MVTIQLKKDWKRDGLKTVPAGTTITVDEWLHEELDKKGLFTEKPKAKKVDTKTNEKE